MSSEVFNAIRARTPQTAALLIIAALLAAVAAAGPWYALTVTTRAATTVVESAPPEQRTVTLHGSIPINGDPARALDEFAGVARAALPVPGAHPVLGLSRDKLVYRADFCSTARLTGSCPQRAGEVAVGVASAQRLKLKLGSELTEPVRLRVVAIYEPGSDTLYTSAATFTDPRLAQADVTYTVPLPVAALRGDDGYDLRPVIASAAAGAKVDNATGPLLDAVDDERGTIRRGVLIALGQVLVLGWLTAGLAGRYTGRERRADAALLKLRGGTRFGVLRLALGQHLLPLLGGAIAGAPLGVLAARLLSGGAPVRPELGSALGLGAAAVGAAMLIALVVLALVDLVLARGPIAVLLRRVRVGRRDWRGDVADLALIVVAAGAVVQARSGSPDSGVGSVAPALVALAVGLVLARLLGLVADRAGGVALRAGRLRSGLTAVQVSRQPGTDRVFALAVVAVALAATTAGGFAVARTDRAGRAAQELGAARVLTVQAPTVTSLLWAVHRADPGGKQARAALVDRSASPPLVLVENNGVSAPSLPLITGTTLSLTVRNGRAVPADLTLLVQHEATGVIARVRFPAAAPGEHTVEAAVPGCTATPGCRLVRWQLTSPSTPDGRRVPGTVTIRGLAQRGPDTAIAGAAQLADPTLWRTDFTGVSLAIGTTAAGLSMTPDPGPNGVSGDSVYAADSRLPLPVVLAGNAPSVWRLADPAIIGVGTQPLPVQVTGTARSLPVVGATGILADLDAARRVAGESELRGEAQVWLTADADPGIVTALKAAGVTVLGEDTTTARAERYSRQGLAATGRFALFTVVVAVLLAAAMTAVAAVVDRGPQTDRLRSLRAQGLPSRTAITISYAVPAALAVVSVLGGLIAALVAVPVAGAAPPWLPAIPATLGLFGLTAWISARSRS
ncbi:ABC transporter permease [Winogradskya humida]|uniref:FtsX-like permease family protein n=1 Tax=Winogradskya humida TaxID=113566 RepID=A0ABQ3ZL90_9ACTN|nr:ABC transporter permease [Actinoplanes humidus]GIE19355.1 hypothetical protein Ahu01nite_024570 [Actinoplanes humidus]